MAAVWPTGATPPIGRATHASRIALQVQRLRAVYFRDAGVADQHVS